MEIPVVTASAKFKPLFIKVKIEKLQVAHSPIRTFTGSKLQQLKARLGGYLIYGKPDDYFSDRFL